MMKSILQKVIDGQDLLQIEAYRVMKEMMDGNISSAQMASFLTALRMKGETVDELIGLAKGVCDQSAPIKYRFDQAVDTCGTGGDGGKTFNISTAAAIVAAAAGVPVIKHGNRAVSSKSGSADVLEALNMNIHLKQDEAARLMEKTGLCFLYAPLYHQAMKHVMPTRTELGFRTCFNLLGPLTNPARVKVQLLGVYDVRLTEKVAYVLAELGVERALVAAGLDGLDEITVTDATRISELKDGEVRTYEVTPESLGVSRSPLAEIRGGSAPENARIIEQILQGKPGAPADIVSVNAGAVLYLSDRASSLAEGTCYAKEIIQSGMAKKQLRKVVEASKEVSYVS
ncbi:anthranilate phosphoribosyltransferase [Thermoactinomyces mirandus]|uniref:Anthranilate phosphoribosyltransferase n=1 Tax=Thermoactinomyces mirandus TaxID=2756294 RepID=A0A7W1XSM7_9BACL|nr:anthranilate phosphoribosyltransferase [Thermoactinomyces mirandus]MBA4602553.1 anthranilate phosphoribosyltransferase [Thermoactinomyces mirandus]